VKAPDLAEPLRGWRAWRVTESRAGLRLCSVIYDEVWTPGQPLRATCAAGEGEHRSPAAGCGCGIYASRSSTAAARYLIGRNDPFVRHRVVGVVSLWGAVFEGAGGWRAELAYPNRLWVPHTPGSDEIARMLRSYGVPVETIAAPAGVGAVAGIASLSRP
jgi:hypothetical protein